MFPGDGSASLKMLPSVLEGYDIEVLQIHIFMFLNVR